MSKQSTARYLKALQGRKDKLTALAGEHTNEAFARVRLVKGNREDLSWLEAYDLVLQELETQKQKDEEQS